MGCNCGSKNRQQWRVAITDAATGDKKYPYTGSVKSVVENVAKRYPGSKVEAVGGTSAKT